MGIVINVNEAAAAGASGSVSVTDTSALEERVKFLENQLVEVVKVLEVVGPIVAEMAPAGALAGAVPQPCDCGNPECPRQKAYEAYVAEGGEDRVTGGSGGQYI